MSNYRKDPADVLDYAKDFSAWLAAGETIASHTVTVATGLTKDSDSHTTSKVTVWLSGGTAGTDYSVTYHITTNQGRTIERTDKIQVRDQ